LRAREERSLAAGFRSCLSPRGPLDRVLRVPSGRAPLPNGPIVLQTNVPLARAGQEWYSPPFLFKAGQVVRVTAAGTTRFYLDLFDTVFVNAQAQRTPRQPFPFKFGMDRPNFDAVATIPVATTYQVVMRLGVFSRPGVVHVEVR
jgi:hypothetical protein